MLDDDDEEGYTPQLALQGVLNRAEGRRLVLGNNPAELRKAVDSKAEPDLARARELFAAKKADEAQRLLRKLVRKPGSAGNGLLKLHVAQLLCEQGRGKAAVELLDPAPARYRRTRVITTSSAWR